MTCPRCGGDLTGEGRKVYAFEKGQLVQIHGGCTRSAAKVVNVFHELGFPDVKRDRSQKGYVWY